MRNYVFFLRCNFYSYVYESKLFCKFAASNTPKPVRVRGGRQDI